MLVKRMAVGIGVLGGLFLLSAPVYGLGLSSSAIEEDTKLVKEVVETIQTPKLEQPKWLKQEIAEEKQKNTASTSASSQASAAKANIIVTYDTTTKGSITANFSEFKVLANQTLNDARGWSRMGVAFKEVASGGQFTLVLSEASQLPTFSSGCSAEYSCRAGRFVIINQDRWQGATSSWNNAGGSLRDYRHMVVNHETGHWLGHGHGYCGGQGQSAPVMAQQSITLAGCKFNPWPLANELSAPALGI
jgi:hypothetical protein